MGRALAVELALLDPELSPLRQLLRRRGYFVNEVICKGWLISGLNAHEIPCQRKIFGRRLQKMVADSAPLISSARGVLTTRIGEDGINLPLRMDKWIDAGGKTKPERHDLVQKDCVPVRQHVEERKRLLENFEIFSNLVSDHQRLLN